MMDIEELKRLHANSTQGEWVSNSCESSQRDYARITLAGKGSYVGDACENLDGAWIAAIHNAFPAIVSKLEAAQRLRKILHHMRGDVEFCMRYPGAAREVTAAIAAFDKEQQ